MAKRTPQKKNDRQIFAGVVPCKTCKVNPARMAVQVAVPHDVLHHRRMSKKPKTRAIRLRLGPHDREIVRVPEDMTACRVKGELYGYLDYAEDMDRDTFVHIDTWLIRNTSGGFAKIKADGEKVKAWMEESDRRVRNRELPVPMSTLIPMSPAIIGAHWLLHRYDRKDHS